MNIVKNCNELIEETIKEIQIQVRIDSVRDVENKQPGMPFGPGINQAVDEFVRLSSEIGMRTYKDPQGLYAYSEIGPKDAQMIGIVGHLDVVPVNDISQWTEALPFSGDIVDNKIVSRGSLDDKGPMVINLMAIKALIKSGVEFKKRVRVIVGTAEETTWECIERYNELEEMPSMSYSPDANFPLINAEKTIERFDLNATNELKNVKVYSLGAYNAVADKATYEGDKVDAVAKELDDLGFEYELEKNKLTTIGMSAHAMATHLGENAITRLAQGMYAAGINTPSIDFLATKVKQTYNGELITEKLYEEDVSGKLTLNVGNIEIENGIERIGMDSRIPVLFEADDIIRKYKEVAKKFGFNYKQYKRSEKLYVPEDDVLVATLMEVYKEVTGEEDAKPLSTGGGTYARAMKNSVAFGCVFASKGMGDKMHQPNESFELEFLPQALEIYAKAIYNLSK